MNPIAIMRKALEFYANEENYHNLSLDEWRKRKNSDPIISIRCGRFFVESLPGYALSEIQLDENGKRALEALEALKSCDVSQDIETMVDKLLDKLIEIEPKVAGSAYVFKVYLRDFASRIINR